VSPEIPALADRAVTGWVTGWPVIPPGFPAPGADSVARRYLSSLIDGSVTPPACLGALLLPIPATTIWSYGRLRVHICLDDILTLTPGVIFGGYVTCLVDHFASLVMLTVLPDDARVLTATTETAFHAPLFPGDVAIEASVTKVSARRALAEVTFQQGQGIASRGVAEQIIKRDVAANAPPGPGAARQPARKL
jgi:acyl-coenzyme A thioesterase PaaI-like protein